MRVPSLCRIGSCPPCFRMLSTVTQPPVSRASLLLRMPPGHFWKETIREISFPSSRAVYRSPLDPAPGRVQTARERCRQGQRDPKSPAHLGRRKSAAASCSWGARRRAPFPPGGPPTPVRPRAPSPPPGDPLRERKNVRGTPSSSKRRGAPREPQTRPNPRTRAAGPRGNPHGPRPGQAGGWGRLARQGAQARAPGAARRAGETGLAGRVWGCPGRGGGPLCGNKELGGGPGLAPFAGRPTPERPGRSGSGPGEGPAGRTWSAKSSAVPIRSFWPMATAGGSARLRSLARWPSTVGARARCGLHRKCPAAGLAPRRLRLQRLPRRPSLKGAAHRPDPPRRVLKGPCTVPSLATGPLEATPAALDATPLTLEAPPTARRPCGTSRPG